MENHLNTQSPQQQLPSAQEKTENKNKEAKFPTWDILPPNQIINPRIRSGS